MSHDPLYFAQVFGFFLYVSLYLLAVWGLFWVLRVLLAPLVREILKGVRFLS